MTTPPIGFLPGPRRPDLAAELTHCLDVAREHWQRLARQPATARPAGLGQGRHTDYRNAVFLGRLIGDYGWPDLPLVGQDAAEAAYLIALHADPRRDVQVAAMREMFQAVRRGTASKRDWVHLHDRVLCADGAPQVYGTQHQLSPDGIPVRLPVRDPEELDVRRREVGLPPAAEALAALRQRLAAEPTSHAATDDPPTANLTAAA
ncbi:DUF6624 domain-containing protein [Streptomyces globisporus]|uniref:DUF6624 domain-containing protein n=1 Tax=Streptomyces globisporus TaxID=1908 RepID=UPI0036477B94